MILGERAQKLSHSIGGGGSGKRDPQMSERGGESGRGFLHRWLLAL